MWEIYDELINMMPRNLIIKDFMPGLHWFLVRSIGVGMAMTLCEGQSSLSSLGKIAGKKVSDAAQYIKSWNNYEAALGLAAINSVINMPEQVESAGNLPLECQVQENVFEYMKERIKGKKIAVIGHFRELEKIAPLCRLSILERRPMPGDLPDPACEYILPQHGFFMDGAQMVKICANEIFACK